MGPNLVVMLTHNDVTVRDAHEIFLQCRDLPITHWGFKDVGLAKNEMRELVGTMRNAGKSTFLEVVSLSEEECMRGAELAVECDFDYLMGTVFYDSVFDFLKSKPINYFPFCGKVSGHPSVLEGSAGEIAADAQRLEARGVAGIDLLAYRHAAEAENVVKNVVEKLHIPVVVAGSINNPGLVDRMKSIAPWGFTIGSALFEKRFVDGGDFRYQLQAVYEHLQKDT